MSDETVSVAGNDKKREPLPAERFPEFQGCAAWNEKPVKSLARVTQGGTPSTSSPEYWGGTINWMTPAEMGESDHPYFSSTKRKLTEEGLSKCSSDLLPAHSVIVSTRAPIGHLAINLLPTAINQGCKGLVPVENGLFLYYALARAKHRLMDFGAGNTFKELSVGALRRFVLKVPSESEQKKIADCLGSLDNLIAAQRRKLSALRGHKKGLMQQLFTREGETIPRLRFPEFRDALDWTRQRLEVVAQDGLTNGIFNDTNKIVSSYRLINVNEMYLENPIVSSDLAFAQADELEIRKKLAYPGDLFFTRSSLVPEGIAFSNIYIGGSDKTTFDGHLIRLRPNVDIVQPLFLHYALKSDHVRSQLIAKSKSATMTTIGQRDVAETMLWLPRLVEQKRIAHCLSALDSQIAAQAKKLDALHTHKRGLMQQLFPAPDDAST